MTFPLLLLALFIVIGWLLLRKSRVDSDYMDSPEWQRRRNANRWQHRDR